MTPQELLAEIFRLRRSPDIYDLLVAELETVINALDDAQRLDWLERELFDRHWDGTIGRPSTWRMAGPHRHTLQKMRGENLRAAIDTGRAP